MQYDFFKIPLSTGNQTRKVKLGGVTFSLNIQYKQTDSPDIGGGWFFDVTNEAAGETIYGIPMRFNTNLFEQFRYKHWGSFFVFHPSGLQKTEATFEQMDGINVILGWTAE
jgi:hypothetical protein